MTLRVNPRFPHFHLLSRVAQKGRGEDAQGVGKLPRPHLEGQRVPGELEAGCAHLGEAIQASHSLHHFKLNTGMLSMHPWVSQQASGRVYVCDLRC